MDGVMSVTPGLSKETKQGFQSIESQKEDSIEHEEKGFAFFISCFVSFLAWYWIQT